MQHILAWRLVKEKSRHVLGHGSSMIVSSLQLPSLAISKDPFGCLYGIWKSIKVDFQTVLSLSLEEDAGLVQVVSLLYLQVLPY